MIRTFVLVAALGFATPALAEETPAAEAPAVQQIGPTVGQTAPDFSAIASGGETVGYADIGGLNGVAIAFVRSADWCPYCKGQLKDLEAAKAPLAEAGWGLAAISYDSPETLAAFKDKHDLTYPLLSDEGSAMIETFGLRKEDVKPGSRFDGIPHPAVVFVRSSGTVGAVLREEGYKKRPQVEVIVETAGYLNEAAG